VSESRVVLILHRHGGAICTYDQIAEQVWGVGAGVSSGAIYELVKRVRQKVEPDWREPCYVVTVPREGYRLKISEERGGSASQQRGGVQPSLFCAWGPMTTVGELLDGHGSMVETGGGQTWYHGRGEDRSCGCPM
jgi:hypothetical protein